MKIGEIGAPPPRIRDPLRFRQIPDAYKFRAWSQRVDAFCKAADALHLDAARVHDEIGPNGDPRAHHEVELERHMRALMMAIELDPDVKPGDRLEILTVALMNCLGDVLFVGAKTEVELQRRINAVLARWAPVMSEQLRRANVDGRKG